MSCRKLTSINDDKSYSDSSWMSEYVDVLWDIAGRFYSGRVGHVGAASLFSSEYAAHLDDLDELKTYRDAFIFPKPAPTSPVHRRTIYLCGNSLGLQPKSLKAAVTSQLDKWADEGVEGHFSGNLTSMNYRLRSSVINCMPN